jgi:hypothetical protein
MGQPSLMGLACAQPAPSRTRSADSAINPPSREPPSDDFEEWRDYWRTAGIYTLADQFGDDDNRGGEFEAFLSQVDRNLLDQVQSEVGGRRKPQVGAGI